MNRVIGHSSDLIAQVSVWCALIAISACTEPGERTTNVTSRDSAGILIVETSAPTWSAADGWQLASEPQLTIGREEGDPEYLFDGIRGVLRLTDGRIVVADGGSSQIRFFDPSGDYVEAIGRAGEGPGEFRFMGSMWRHGADSLVVTDLPGVTFMGSDGQFGRRSVVELAEGQYRGNPVGQLDDGALLVVTGSRGFSPADAGTVIRDSLRFFWYNADGTFGGPITVLPSAERWGLQAGGVTTFPYLPFASNPIWTASGDRFYTGAGRGPEVSLWRADGTLERVLRWAKAERPVTDALKDQFRADALESARDANDRRRVELFLAEVPIAESLPAYRSMLVDEEHNLWLEAYRPPWELAPSWDVLTSDGEWLGSVSMPARFTPYQIGSDYVLGVSRDELGVERVESFRLAKSTSGS
jgi:hypothetical protein